MKIDWSEHYLKKGSPNEPTYYIIRGNYYSGGAKYFVITILLRDE